MCIWNTQHGMLCRAVVAALQKPGRVFGEKDAIYKGRVRFPFRAAAAS